MAKIHKVYPGFYNGVTEQSAELAMDTQCKEMLNCIPSLINDLHKRPPVKYIRQTEEFVDKSKIFHTYDRGEDDEEYIFVNTGNYDEPIKAYNKEGIEMVVEFESGNETALKNYLNSSNLKGLTVQDRTWLLNKDATVVSDTTGQVAPDANYDKTAYYWLKRGSGDKYNPYNYAVYLDGVTYECNTLKPPSDVFELETGFEDSDYSATYLKNRINGSYEVVDYEVSGSAAITDSFYIGINLTGVGAPTSLSSNFTVGSWSYDSDTGYYTVTVTNTSATTNYIDFTIPFDGAPGFSSEAVGSLLKIYKDNGDDFTFDVWDSWGNQASEGWKGSVNKLTDLPKDFPWDDTYVEIIGDETDAFTNYYVRWNSSSWVETRSPSEIRGVLTNMPIAMERTAISTEGIVTFTVSQLEWLGPLVGNSDNNPDPSFVGYKISDIFFYRNRLGLASSDSVVLSEAANYDNFYIDTALDILDNDPVDVAVVSNKASKVYYVKPFNNSLFIFTKDSQFELAHEGYLSPKTVSVENTTNYPMAVDVEPKVVNNSLYFVSVTENKQQLREYIKTDKLSVEGVDLSITTPNYLEEKITNIIVNGVLGMVLCCTATNVVYLYNFKDNGQERVQSAWSRWELLDGYTDVVSDSYEYEIIDSTLLIACKTADKYLYHQLQLDEVFINNKLDVGFNGDYPFVSKVKLPDYYPHIDKIGTPKDKVLIKKVTVQGEGSFSAEVYRKDYNKTYSKSYSQSMKDLDMHVTSKVGNVEITVTDDTSNDFSISSIIVEGLFSPTSKEMR